MLGPVSADKNVAMTGAELENGMGVMGWTDRHLAGELQCSAGKVKAMRESQAPVPEVLAVWMSSVVAFYRACPPPHCGRRPRDRAPRRRV